VKFNFLSLHFSEPQNSHVEENAITKLKVYFCHIKVNIYSLSSFLSGTNNKQKKKRKRHETHRIEYAITIVFEVFKG